MKKSWLVEYDFVETVYGNRPMWIRFFNSLEEANKFAETVSDAVVSEFEEI